MANFSGVMENITLDNGRMARRVVVDIGDPRRGKATWENGVMDK